MREGDTDPSVISQRAPAQSAIHSYVGPGLTALLIVCGFAVQWGTNSARQSNQENAITAIKTAQLSDEAKISELLGNSASFGTRLSAIENQDIPGHFSKLDNIVAQLSQQAVDQQKRSDDARKESSDWQKDMSDKMDKLITAVAHLEGSRRTGQ